MDFRSWVYQANAVVQRHWVLLSLVAMFLVGWQVLAPAIEASDAAVTPTPESKFDGPTSPIKDHWEKFVMYNSTAQTALQDLRAFVHEHHFSLPLFSLDSNPRVCVGVETARREGSSFKYLAQTLASLVTRISSRKEVYIHVFNVDDEPELHTEVDEIRDLFPVSNLKAHAPPGTARKLQEGLDFADLFEAMHSWEACESLVLIEDDALAQQDWVDRIDLAANQLRDRNWFMVRLYLVRKNYPAHTPVGISDFDQGFNTVALMINREYLLALAEETRAAIARVFSTGDRQYFTAKDEFMNDHLSEFFGLPVMSFEPPIFQHTGIFSSVGWRDREVLQYYMQAPNWESENQPIVFARQVWEAMS